MKLLLSTNHRIYATDVPESVEPLIKQWFGAKRTDNGWQVPRRLVWAFINYYPGVEVSPSLQAWLTNHYSRNEVLGRVRKHLHRYRGGYQAKIVAHAIDRRSHGIFTGFGSGKTMILLEIARQVGPTLLVVPPLIWQNAYVDQSKDVKGRPHGDLLRWYRDLRWVASMSTRDREQRIASFSARADIYAVSPGLVGSMRHVLSQIPLAAIMVDESAVMRNQNAAITKTLLELAPSVTFRVLATAEPAPDNLGELYTQVRFLDPHRLGTRAEFDAQYGQRGQWGVVYRDRQKSVAALNEINHDGLVTVLTETEFWPDAPPLDVVKVPVRLGKSQSRAYKARRDNLSIRIGDDEITSSNTIRQVMDLRQLTAGFLYDRGKAKQVCEYPAKLKYVEKLLRLPHHTGARVSSASSGATSATSTNCWSD